MDKLRLKGAGLCTGDYPFYCYPRCWRRQTTSSPTRWGVVRFSHYAVNQRHQARELLEGRIAHSVDQTAAALGSRE